jgi:hypothetical protein
MKKIIALAFVAGMVSFAACTSKPSEESSADSVSVEATLDSASATLDSASATLDSAAAKVDSAAH